jgi:signal transduction histidine kinase
MTWRELFLIMLLGWACACGAQAFTQELREVRVTSAMEGAMERKDVVLPYNWDRLHHSRPGDATFEVPFSLPGEPSEPYGAYISRVGNLSEIWLNGALLSRNGDLDSANVSDHAKVPLHVIIPSQLLQKDNLFRIHIHADGGRRGGLSKVIIGPESEVRSLFEAAYRWRVTGSIAVAVFSLMVGVMALVLWVTQSDRGQVRGFKRDSLYLYAGVAELCWMVRLSDVVLVHPPLNWPWWGIVQSMAYAGWVCCVALFCHDVAGWHRHASMRWVRVGLWSMVLSSAPLAYWALTRHEDLFLTGWYGFATFLFIGYGLFYFAAALRRPSAERLLVAAVGVFNVLVGVRDWMVIRISDNFGEVPWMRYSSVLFGLALAYIVIIRFREASAQSRDLMRNMAAKVKEKELALDASYRQLELLAREQERTAERTRILRDMHDGVGSHISSAIRQLQSGKASDAQLLQTLRDSLDQLKLSIDAMNLPPGDITALLANLRYRLEPRFAASDIELQWQVDVLPPLASLDAKAMRQLQFMVFEALSNVLQHAQASVLRIELRTTPQGGAQLRVIDNGCGFDLQRVQRKGLSSLRERAVAIGARLEVRSSPGGTVVEIVLEPEPMASSE